MKKTVSALVFSFCCFLNINANADNNLSYSHDHNHHREFLNWMRDVHDDNRLIRMSLLGTHDSGALRAGDAIQTQSMTIDVQLNAGIRLFDIRLRHWENKMYVYHGSSFQELSFGNVLDDMTDYLRDHPSETLIVRVKKEMDSHRPHTSFGEGILEYIQTEESYFYRRGAALKDVTLGEVRGKIVLLRDFTASGDVTSFGYKYSKNHPDYINTDDDYLATNWALYDKWLGVKEALTNANNEVKNIPQNYNKAYVTFLSGSGGAFPYFVVSGKSSSGTYAPRLATGLTTPGWNSYPDFPRVNCAGDICTIAFEGTNILSENLITKKAHLFNGWVFTDFPGPKLIKTVHKANYPQGGHSINQRYIDSQSELNLLKTTGYLKELLSKYNKVSIKASNGNWLSEIKLPKGNIKQGNQIHIDVKSAWSVTIDNDGNKITVKRGESKGYTFKNNRWDDGTSVGSNTFGATTGKCYWLSTNTWKWEHDFDTVSKTVCDRMNKCNRGGVCYKWEWDPASVSKPTISPGLLPRCYWLSNRTWKWVEYLPAKTEEACVGIDKCSRGGACYKWRYPMEDMIR